MCILVDCKMDRMVLMMAVCVVVVGLGVMVKEQGRCRDSRSWFKVLKVGCVICCGP